MRPKQRVQHNGSCFDPALQQQRPQAFAEQCFPAEFADSQTHCLNRGWLVEDYAKPFFPTQGQGWFPQQSRQAGPQDVQDLALELQRLQQISHIQQLKEMKQLEIMQLQDLQQQLQESNMPLHLQHHSFPRDVKANQQVPTSTHRLTATAKPFYPQQFQHHQRAPKSPPPHPPPPHGAPPPPPWLLPTKPPALPSKPEAVTHRENPAKQGKSMVQAPRWGNGSDPEARVLPAVDWVMWTPSKMVPPSLQQKLSPHHGNVYEADISGASNNEHEGEEQECDLDLSKITSEYFDHMSWLLRRSPTPNGPLGSGSTGKKKRRQKKRNKKDPRRRTSPTPVFSEDRFHVEEHSSSEEDATSEDGADDRTSPCARQGLRPVDAHPLPQPNLSGIDTEDSDPSLSGEELNPIIAGIQACSLDYRELDQQLPPSLHRCIPLSTPDIASKRLELVESPVSKVQFKEFLRQLKEQETHGSSYDKARQFALEVFAKPGTLPEKVFWRVCMEIADLAKRENLVEEAAYWFHKVNQLQPFASQGWLEHAKMEEECGRLEACQYILSMGLRFCPHNESLLVKGVKHKEQAHDLAAARSLLARLKTIRLEKSWKTILEGALLEARAGRLPIARKVFKYLIKNIPRHGPIYQEAFKLEEKCEQFHRAMDIVEKGLVANPRYGPLWFGAFRLYERMALQEPLPPHHRRAGPPAPPSAAPFPGHQHLRCPQCAFRPLPLPKERNGDPHAPSAPPRQSLTVTSQPFLHSPLRRVVKSTGPGVETSLTSSSLSSSPLASPESSPHVSPRASEDPDAANVSYCSSVGESVTCDSARSTCTSMSTVSCTLHPVMLARPRAALAMPRGPKAPHKGLRRGAAPACLECCPHVRSLQQAAALAAVAPQPVLSDVSRVRDAVQRAVQSISRELVWKVYFESAQIEERAGNIVAARQAYVLSAMHALPNLRWKVWLGGARTELNCDNIETARQLLDRALTEVPRKTRAVVLLECARLEEYDGNLAKARAILQRAHKETKHEWKVFLESILLELRAGNVDGAIRESLAALEIHRGTGRLWAVLIQLKHRDGEAEQNRVFREALGEVPKSGEVWCEGARMCMNPLSALFNLRQAQQFLDFAIKFTPQYGDSFVEYLRLELLTTGQAVNPQLEQLCINAEPNYGPMWFHCKLHPLHSTRQVLRTAKTMLQTEMAQHKAAYQQAIVAHQAAKLASHRSPGSTPALSPTFVTGLPSLNEMYRNVHALPSFLRRRIIFGSEHITP
eukprot:EG_transcript_456